MLGQKQEAGHKLVHTRYVDHSRLPATVLIEFQLFQLFSRLFQVSLKLRISGVNYGGPLGDHLGEGGESADDIEDITADDDHEEDMEVEDEEEEEDLSSGVGTNIDQVCQLIHDLKEQDLKHHKLRIAEQVQLEHKKLPALFFSHFLESSVG